MIDYQKEVEKQNQILTNQMVKQSKIKMQTLLITFTESQPDPHFLQHDDDVQKTKQTKKI